MGTPPPTSELQQSQPQALHYALANAQQVQIHQIGEDGQVQVVRTVLLHVWAVGGGWGEALAFVHSSSVCSGLLEAPHSEEAGLSLGAVSTQRLTRVFCTL